MHIEAIHRVACRSNDLLQAQAQLLAGDLGRRSRIGAFREWRSCRSITLAREVVHACCMFDVSSQATVFEDNARQAWSAYLSWSWYRKGGRRPDTARGMCGIVQESADSTSFTSSPAAGSPIRRVDRGKGPDSGLSNVYAKLCGTRRCAAKMWFLLSLRGSSVEGTPITE